MECLEEWTNTLSELYSQNRGNECEDSRVFRGAEIQNRWMKDNGVEISDR